MACEEDTVAVPGSYRQYKADTAAFLAWLQRTALACGYQYENALDRRAPNKQSEPEIRVADLQLPVREILSQARIICSSVKELSCIPKRVCTLATRAISTRETFTERWSNVVDQSPDDVARNASHKFFTSIMGEALDLLKKHSEQSAQAMPMPAAAVHPPQDGVTRLNNQFEHLDLEDCEEADWSLQVPDSSHEQHQTTTTNPMHKRDDPIYPIDVHVDVEDTLMRIYCFFNDLRLIRTQVEALWKDYKAGLRDLIPVSVASNAAIAIAEQMEHELLEEIFPDGQLAVEDAPDYLGVKSFYAAILGVSLALSSGERKWSHLDPLIQSEPFSQGFFADLAITLHKLSDALIHRKRYGWTLQEYAALHHAGKANDTDLINYYPRVKTAEFVFMIHSMQPKKAFSSPSFERLHKGDELLTSVLVDIVLRKEVNLYVEGPALGSIPCTDELTKALMQLENGKVGAAAILGCAILQDTWDTFGPTTKDIFLSVRSFAEQCRKVVDGASVQMTELQWRNKLIWHGGDHRHLRNMTLSHAFLVDEPRSWSHFHTYVTRAQSPPILKLRPSDDTSGWQAHLARLPLTETEHAYRLKQIRAHGEHRMPISPSPTMQIVGNPLASSTILFNLTVQKVEAGIALANTHILVLNAAYLYVALKSQKLLKGDWREMGQVIDTHLSEMFFGGIPADPIKTQNLWAMRTGNHPSQVKPGEKFRFVVKGGHRTGRLPLKSAQASCLSTSDTTEIFSRWLDGRDSMLKAVHAAHQKMTAKTTQGKKKHSRPPTLDSLNFLESFADFIELESRAWKFDYIRFVNTCNDLLEAVHGKFRDGHRTKKDGTAASKLAREMEEQRYGKEMWGNDGLKTFAMVDSLLWQDKLWFENTAWRKKMQKKGVKSEQSPMVAVGKFMQEYMDGHKMLVHEVKDKVVDASKLTEMVEGNARAATTVKSRRAYIEAVVDEEVLDHAQREWGQWPCV